MTILRNKQREKELIEKRNKAYKEADKYDNQLRKEMGILDNKDSEFIGLGDFYNKGKKEDDNTMANEIARLMNGAHGEPSNKGKKEDDNIMANEIARLMNEAR